MIDQYPPANGVLTSLIWRKTATGGETSLSGYDNASQALSYTPGQEQVYLNGILLVRGSDYTATNGTSITGLTALAADDFVQVNCYNNFSVASVPAASITGTVTNAQLANSAITINGTSTSLGGTYTNASASTSTAGIVQLTDSTSSTSTSTAATPNAVKSAYDLANGAIPKTLTTTTGDIIYASGANTPARLGIGSTGNVLTVASGVPSWVAPASGGGMTQLGSTTTLSGTTTTVSSISGSYKHLLIIIDRVTSTQADSYNMITVTPNSLTTATTLTYNQYTYSGFSELGIIPTSFTNNQASLAGEQSYAIWIYNYAATNLWKPVFITGHMLNTSIPTPFRMGVIAGGAVASTDAITSLTFTTTQPSTNGGSVLIYGVS